MFVLTDTAERPNELFCSNKAKHSFSHFESIKDIEAPIMQSALLLVQIMRIKLMNGNPYIESILSSMTLDIVSLIPHNMSQYNRCIYHD